MEFSLILSKNSVLDQNLGLKYQFGGPNQYYFVNNALKWYYNTFVSYYNPFIHDFSGFGAVLVGYGRKIAIFIDFGLILGPIWAITV